MISSFRKPCQLRPISDLLWLLARAFLLARRTAFIRELSKPKVHRCVGVTMCISLEMVGGLVFQVLLEAHDRFNYDLVPDHRV